MDFKMENIEKLVVDFSVRNEFGYQKIQPETVLKTISMLGEFTWEGNATGRFVNKIEGNFIHFEERAIQFITAFLDKLKAEKQRIEYNLTQLRSAEK
jgi:hypothetical protein